MRLIEHLKETSLVGAGWRGHVRQRFQIEHGSAFASYLRALVNRWQPAGGPVANAIHGQPTRIAEDNISRQVLPLGAEAINHPRTPRWPPGLEFPAVNDAQRRLVID